VPLIVELLRGKDFRQKKRLLYAIKNIRYSYDWNFRITEPILIETLFSLRKYKSLEWPLLEVLLDYKFEGYLDILEKWFSSSNTSILSPILFHLTYVGRFDCLLMLEKKAAGRQGSQLTWPLLVASLKTIGGRNKTLVVYLEAIVMQLFRRGFISLKDLKLGSIREDQLNYMHLLCLYGTEEVTALIDEICPYVQKDYLAYYYYRVGKVADLTGIFNALHRHQFLHSYKDFACSVGMGNMRHEWKIAILQYFLENKTGGDKFENAWRLSIMFDWAGEPNFIKENILIVKDKDVASALLKLHTIKTFPAVTVLSDLLQAGLLNGVQKERLMDEIESGKRNAPHALPGYLIEVLSGKFVHNYDYDFSPFSIYIGQHIQRWAKDCGKALFDELFVYSEFDKENEYCGLIKAVLHDRVYIMEDITGKGFQDFGSVRALLNTILEYENIPERIVPMLHYFQGCDVFGDVEKLETLAAKYDFRRIEEFGRNIEN
jgi:hypothetical protein